MRANRPAETESLPLRARAFLGALVNSHPKSTASEIVNNLDFGHREAELRPRAGWADRHCRRAASCSHLWRSELIPGEDAHERTRHRIGPDGVADSDGPHRFAGAGPAGDLQNQRSWRVRQQRQGALHPRPGKTAQRSRHLPSQDDPSRYQCKCLASNPRPKPTPTPAPGPSPTPPKGVGPGLGGVAVLLGLIGASWLYSRRRDDD